MDVRGQVPFLRLLIPVVLGILFSNFTPYSGNLLFVGIVGVILVLFSFFKSKRTSYSLRWVFGAGLMLSLFFLSTQYFNHFKDLSSYNFPQQECSYLGEVLDLPQQKKRSVACEVQMTYPVSKKTLLYFEPDDKSQLLKPGDLIIINASIEPFKNSGNPDEFDYKGFMEQKGFSGTAYIRSSEWINSGKINHSLKSTALRARGKLLDHYKTFGLNDDEYAFLSALTLGYKADLSNELKQAFRVSGTSHVLAVSGLHVGIVYIIIVSLFFFLKGKGKRFILKQILILLTLWTYVFITGMSVSVIRAAIMLTLFCVGNMFQRKGYHYNTLAVAAFFILIINPYYLFDVGFQLSFAAVLSILFFQPKISKLFTPKNKASRYVWNLMTVSLAAQLGVFPLGLFYFGTFPNYFFLANLLVIPFLAFIMYSTFALSVVSLIAVFNFSFLNSINKVIGFILQFLIKTVLRIIYFFESLPFALSQDIYITYIQLCLIFIGLFSLTFFILKNRANTLIVFLLSVALLLTTYTYTHLKEPVNQFIVYNNFNQPDMGYLINGKNTALQVVSNKVIAHPTASIFLLTENLYKSKKSDIPVPVDYLILSSDNSFSMIDLCLFFKPTTVIIDSSIPRYSAEKIKKDCEVMNVAFHDISNSGAYSINF